MIKRRTMSDPLIFAGVVIGCIVTFAGLAIFYNSFEQTKWQPVPAKIIESSIERLNVHTAGEVGHREYWAFNIKYSYVVEGETYTSDHYSSSPPKSLAKNDTPPSLELKQLLDEYPSGGAITVYVAPNNPERVLVQPSRSPTWSILVIGLSILAFVCLSLFAF